MAQTKFQMQAQDSALRTLVSWLSDFADFAGLGFPTVGGSVPLDPAISGGGILIPDTFDTDVSVVAISASGSYAISASSAWAVTNRRIAVSASGATAVSATGAWAVTR